MQLYNVDKCYLFHQYILLLVKSHDCEGIIESKVVHREVKIDQSVVVFHFLPEHATAFLVHLVVSQIK